MNKCCCALTYIYISAQRHHVMFFLTTRSGSCSFSTKRTSSEVQDQWKCLVIESRFFVFLLIWQDSVRLGFKARQESCLKSKMFRNSCDSFLFLVFHKHQARFFSSWKSDKILFSFLCKRILPETSDIPGSVLMHQEKQAPGKNRFKTVD